MEIVSYFKDVPNVIWSGVIGALIALAGVMLSNKGNNKRLNSQLQHDAAEKTKERINALRREVYLQAVECIEATSIHLSSITQRDIAKLNMNEELQAITACMAKLRLVAEPETAKLASQLGVLFGVTLLKMLSRLGPLSEAKTSIEINNEGYLQTNNEALRLKHEINKFHESAMDDMGKLHHLLSSQEFALSKSQEYADARAEAYRSFNLSLSEFSQSMLPDMKELSSLQLKVMIALRNDLGIPSDPAEFQRQLEHQWTVMIAEYGNTMGSMGIK